MHKRKAQEAFETTSGQLSAFAAAKLARQQAPGPPGRTHESNGRITNEVALAGEVASVPYDGDHSRPSSSGSGRAQVVTEPSADRSPQVRFSTFAATSRSVLRDDDECLELELDKDHIIVCIGEYDLQVLDGPGCISIAGTTLQKTQQPQRVYAPGTHALPQARAERGSCRIRLSSVQSGFRKLERLSPLFCNIWNAPLQHDRSFALLETSDDDPLRRSLSLLEIDGSFREIERAIINRALQTSRPPSIAAVGPKSSGKSTFNRHMCNKILDVLRGVSCMYLDLDPGQPEFGPPGQISLVEIKAPILGPPFTHPASSQKEALKLIRSHSIAATTFRDNPEHYMACVADLVNHVNQSHAVIINTCGWVNGAGASVLSDMLSLLAITNLVVVDPVEESLVDLLALNTRNATMHRIPRRVPRPSSRTPAEMRAMQTMSYFHSRQAQPQAVWSGKAISAMRPYVVDYAGPDRRILAVLSYGQTPDPKFLTEVLDGSLVAVVILERPSEASAIFLASNEHPSDHDETSSLQRSIEFTPDGLPFIKPDAMGISRALNPQTSRCIGLALLRSIDVEQRQLHLVTPLPESEIAEVRNGQIVLVRGSFDPPEWAYLEDLHKHGDNARVSGTEMERPWVGKSERLGIEGSVWRLRHPPTAAAATFNR